MVTNIFALGKRTPWTHSFLSVGNFRPVSRVTYVVYFSVQHFVFFVSRLIDLLVPDIPQSLEIKIKREAYLAKQALSEHHGLLGGKSDGESADDLEDDYIP